MVINACGPLKQEGEEPSDFWSVLGGRSDYPRDAKSAANRTPLLFHIRDTAGEAISSSSSPEAPRKLVSLDTFVAEACVVVCLAVFWNVTRPIAESLERSCIAHALAGPNSVKVEVSATFNQDSLASTVSVARPYSILAKIYSLQYVCFLFPFFLSFGN